MPEPPSECRRWNDRYAAEALFFGDAPSPLLVETLASFDLPEGAGRRALCLGEGEGRDALYLARQGFDVVAVDGAAVGLDKLRTRAAHAALPVIAICADLAEYEPPRGAFQLASSFYCHLAPEVRRVVLARTAASLAPGGLFVMEGFARAQRLKGRTSGGPKDVEVLYEPEALRAELGAMFDQVGVEERTMDIDHGRHQGTAEVVRAVARRRR